MQCRLEAIAMWLEAIATIVARTLLLVRGVSGGFCGRSRVKEVLVCESEDKCKIVLLLLPRLASCLGFIWIHDGW